MESSSDAITRDTDGSYTLIFYNKSPSLNAEVQQRMKDTFFLVYHQLVTRFNPSASRTVKFTVDPNYNDVPAATSGADVTFSAKWLRDHPEDTDTATHELMHVVQAYPPGHPDWLREGIADYTRAKYGTNNGPAGWSLPDYSPEHKYTGQYRVTARFLIWLENRVSSSIVNELDSRLRNRIYSDDTWRQLTSKTVDQLWQLYAQNPHLSGSGIQSADDIDIVSGSTYKLINVISGKALDVDGSCTSNHGNVQIYSDNNSVAQRWVIHANADGTVKLINPHSGKALDVVNSGTADGTNVQIFTDNNTAAQKWRLYRVGPATYTLVNIICGKALDVDHSGSADRTNIHIWSQNGTEAQMWRLVPVS